MIHPSRIALVAGVVACALFVSCSDDPAGPGGPYVPPSYQATIQSLDARFWGVTGAGASDLYAVGEILLRFDGARWNALPAPVKYERWEQVAGQGFSDGSFALSVNDQVFMYKDASWTTLPRAPSWIWDLAGTAPDKLCALGGNSIDGGGIFRFDGETWTATPIEKLWEINAFTAGVGDEIWLCGNEGRLDHFDGSEWTSAYLDSMFLFLSIATTPSGRTFIGSNINVVEIIDSTITYLLKEQIYQPVVRTDGEALYAAGASMTGPATIIAKYASNSWRVVAASNEDFRDLWAGHGEIIAVGNTHTIWRGNDNGGRLVEPFPARGEIYDAVTVGNAVYTMGHSSFRFQAGTWTDLEKNYVTDIPGRAIDGRRQDNIYAIGEAMILHYDGRKWEWVNGALGAWLKSLWVESNGDVIAVGDGPVIVEYDGFEWSKRTVNISSGGFTDVIGIEDVVFVVGYDGLLGTRREDNEWYFMRPTNADIRAVWGSDKEHVYAATSVPNQLLFFDGTRWSTMTVDGPELGAMVGVWGTSPANLFVLDAREGLFRFDGRNWAAESNLLPDMRAITGIGNDVLTAGLLGSVLYSK